MIPSGKTHLERVIRFLVSCLSRTCRDSTLKTGEITALPVTVRILDVKPWDRVSNFWRKSEAPNKRPTKKVKTRGGHSRVRGIGVRQYKRDHHRKEAPFWEGFPQSSGITPSRIVGQRKIWRRIYSLRNLLEKSLGPILSSRSDQAKCNPPDPTQKGSS